MIRKPAVWSTIRTQQICSVDRGKYFYLFIWKNVTEASLVLKHVVSLPRIHGRAILRGTPAFEFRAFFRALRQLPDALKERLRHFPHYCLTDREVLARSRKS